MKFYSEDALGITGARTGSFTTAATTATDVNDCSAIGSTMFFR